MRRLANQGWTPEQLARLKQFAGEGASPLRAAAALRRTIAAVQKKALMLGTPFQPRRKVRAARLAREIAQRGCVQ